MKKKYIIIIIFVILLVGMLSTLINKNSKKYIMQDGIMLALTLDGEEIDSYPEGTNYYIEVNCENGKGNWLVPEWQLAVEDITGNVICNIDFKSNPKTLISEVEEVNVNNNYNNHGYRYSGKTPNNYVWFNNEMWRIIGSIPTCLSASCGTNKTNLVKIIRNQSIGSATYGSVSWSSSKLKTLLNNYYYGKKNATNSSYCYNSGTTIRSICNYSANGISDSTTDYYGKMVKNVYWNTGDTYNTNTSSESYVKEITTINSQSRIGLISLSDYGYAADSNYHSISLSNYLNEASSHNWLHFGQYNTINASDGALQGVGPAGNVYNEDGTYGYTVFPVVYLDPSVYIISGVGTEANPYQIGM